MTILLLALLCWMMILVLTVGLCVAAGDGDAQQARSSSSQWHHEQDALGEPTKPPATSAPSVAVTLAEHDAPSVAATHARAA